MDVLSKEFLSYVLQRDICIDGSVYLFFFSIQNVQWDADGEHMVVCHLFVVGEKGAGQRLFIHRLDSEVEFAAFVLAIVYELLKCDVCFFSFIAVFIDVKMHRNHALKLSGKHDVRYAVAGIFPVTDELLLAMNFLQIDVTSYLVAEIFTAFNDDMSLLTGSLNMCPVGDDVVAG